MKLIFFIPDDISMRVALNLAVLMDSVQRFASSRFGYKAFKRGGHMLATWVLGRTHTLNLSTFNTFPQGPEGPINLAYCSVVLNASENHLFVFSLKVSYE